MYHHLLNKYSYNELYIAFLTTYLPRLSSKALFNYGFPTGTRYKVLKKSLEYIKYSNGLNLEFGVFKGASINLCSKTYPNKKFYGFDSFEGFPEDGRSDWKQDYNDDKKI